MVESRKDRHFAGSETILEFVHHQGRVFRILRGIDYDVRATPRLPQIFAYTFREEKIVFPVYAVL